MSSRQNDWDDCRTMDDAAEREADAPRDVSCGDATTQDAPLGDMPGDVLGRIDQYELLEELGTGGFGSVYLAHDTTSRAFVAVEGLPAQVKDCEEEKERVRENFALVSKLHDDHIAVALVLHPAKCVSYADAVVGEKLNVRAGQTLLVMQHAPDVTLSKWRRQFAGAKTPLGPAVEVVRQIASCADFVAALEGMKVAGVKKPSSGSKFLRAASVAALLLVGGLGGWWFQRSGGQKAVSAVASVLSVASVPSGAPKPGETCTLTLPGGAQLEMVWCPPGSFTMGCPESEEGRCDRETPHRVRLTKGFWLGKYEVTQAQWESVMGNNPSRFKGADRPVEKVSWDDCQAFCRKAGQGLRLPTEAEWEYACRAGTTTAYCWGDALNGDRANCDGNYPCGTTAKGPYRQKTTPVGSYESGKNAWGLYDMHGNVWEWCADWYGSYAEDATDPLGPASGESRVYRGGCWYSDARNCRSAYRYYSSPGYRYNRLGFRLCCSAGPSE